MAAPSVWNIPLSVPFLSALAEGIWAHVEHDDARLSDVMILLPNRRACRDMSHAFLRLFDGRAVLLPKLVPIGDLDEDELFFMAGGTGAGLMEIPPAIESLDRHLALAEIILSHARRGGMLHDITPLQALEMAGDLCGLLDQLQIEEIDPQKIMTLLPDDFSEHWQGLLSILHYVVVEWPHVLKQKNKIDPVMRRNALIDLQASLWEKNKPAFPVFAAGSTGTMPATARLLKTVSMLPDGHVVLPGLDRFMPDSSWDIVAPTHPQYSLKNLLQKMGIGRHQVKIWPFGQSHNAREKLLAAFLCPAEQTQSWTHSPEVESDEIREAIENITLIEAKNRTEEAETIALILRDAIRVKGQSACLITPDRKLARQVKSCLTRWDINIDDSAGEPLDKTPLGNLFLQVAEFLSEKIFNPHVFLSLVKNPKLAFGMSRQKKEKWLDAIEHQFFRTEKLLTSIYDLSADDHVIASLQKAFSLFHDTSLFHERLALHIRCMEEWSDENDLWIGEDAESLSRLVADLMGAFRREDATVQDGCIYHAFLRSFFKKVVVRPKHNTHPRLAILGQMEARLSEADCFILGGLNEGIWPPEPEADPWLSRKMRADIGLPPSERTVGLSAHDFAKAFSAKRVFVTRAQKADGSPTIPAPWIVRLKAFLQAQKMTWGESVDWKKILGYLDQPSQKILYYRPLFSPPLSARPKKISVSSLEKLMRDPYVFYAEKILNLKKINDIESVAGAKEKGTLIHAVFEEFANQYQGNIPDNAKDILAGIFERKSNEILKGQDVIRKFWTARFEKLVDAYIEYEKNHSLHHDVVLTEEAGHLTIGAVTLHAKADRIDRHKMTGQYVIIDYKTGATPTKKDVEIGLSPQLVAEAVILENAAPGYTNIHGYVEALEYWELSGGDDNLKKTRFDLKAKKGHLGLRDIVTIAAEKIPEILDSFCSAQNAFISKPLGVKAAGRYQDYDHFCRVLEWHDDKRAEMRESDERKAGGAHGG